MTDPAHGPRPEHTGAETGSRPDWLHPRLLPQSAVIGALVLAVVGYMPAGRPLELAGGLRVALQSSGQRLTVVVNGESREISTQASTVADLLEELGYKGRATANVPEQTRLESLNGPLVIEAAREITIVAGTQTFTIYARSETVGDLLRKIGLEINAERSRAEGVQLGTPLRDGLTVYVKKLVLPLTVTEEEQVPYTTEKVEDPTAPAGSRRVIRPGRVGQRVKTYRVEAGIRGSLHRVLVHTDLTLQPVAERIAVGVQAPEKRSPGYPTLSPAAPVAGASGINGAAEDRSSFSGWNVTPVAPAPGEPLLPRTPSTGYPALPNSRPQTSGPATSAPTPPWVTPPTHPSTSTPSTPAVVPTPPPSVPSTPMPTVTPAPTDQPTPPPVSSETEPPQATSSPSLSTLPERAPEGSGSSSSGS